MFLSLWEKRHGNKLKAAKIPTFASRQRENCIFLLLLTVFYRYNRDIIDSRGDSMDAPQKKINIILKTTIDDDGQLESNEQSYHGVLFQKNNMDVLIFEETLEDGSTIKNLLTIYPHKVSINRSGAVKMNQKFQADQITENIYHHPHGKIHMETYTETIEYKKASNGTEGTLAIHYTVKLNGQDKRKHTLKLAYQEEETQ